MAYLQVMNVRVSVSQFLLLSFFFIIDHLLIS